MGKAKTVTKAQVRRIMKKIRKGEKLTREEKAMLKRYRKQKKSK